MLDTTVYDRFDGIFPAFPLSITRDFTEAFPFEGSLWTAGIAPALRSVYTKI